MRSTNSAVSACQIDEKHKQRCFSAHVKILGPAIAEAPIETALPIQLVAQDHAKLLLLLKIVGFFIGPALLFFPSFFLIVVRLGATVARPETSSCISDVSFVCEFKGSSRAPGG